MLKSFRSRLRQMLSSKPGSSRRRRIRPATVALESLESRLLLTTLNLIPTTGIIVVGGGVGVNNDLTISYSSVTGDYTFTENGGEDVTVDADLAPAVVAGGGVGDGFVTFDAATADAAVTHASGMLNLIRVSANTGDDTLTVDSFRPGSEGLDVQNNAGQGTDEININGNIGTMVSPVQGEVILEAETVNLGASIWTDNEAVSLQGPTELTADATIDAGTDAVIFSDTLDGAFNLIVEGANVDFSMDVGSTTALTSLHATGGPLGIGGSVEVGAGDLTLISDNLILASGATLTGSGELFIAQETVSGMLDFTATDALFTTVIQPGFTEVTLGNSTTGTLRILQDGSTASLTAGAPLNLIGAAVEIRDGIDQEANPLSIETDSLLWQGKGAALGTGDVTITKLTGGGTLSVTGNMGSSKQSWGANNLIVSASGADVSFAGAVGSGFASIDMTADNITFNNASAVTSQGAITFTGNVSLNGGMFSVGGGIEITGDLTLNRNALFKVGGGDLTITGTTTANGNNILIRGAGAPIGTVDLGDVNGAGSFKIDSGGGNTASQVNLADVTATDILVRAVDTDLDGTLTATAGNLHLIGSVNLAGDTTLLNTSGLATKFIRVDGTIDGAFDLDVDSDLGKSVFSGKIGDTVALANMTVNSGGSNFLNRAIKVTDSFSWIVGTASNSIDDRLTISGTGSVTVTGAPGDITLEADVISGEIIGVNLIGGGVVAVIERGAGD